MVEQSFAVVGDLIGRHRQKQAIGEAMRVVGEVNKYVSDTEPWKLKGDDERERLGTVLHVVAQCVADLNLVLSPFLPFSANAVDLALGGTGDDRPDAAHRRGRRPRRRRRLPGHHRRLHLRAGRGSGARSCVGTPVGKPTPVFTKLDPSVVDEELDRLA